LLTLALPARAAGICPEKNILYWQAFTPGGESDLSARHQQLVLKTKCPAIETIIQYKPGAGGGLMWAQMNNLPGDGFNIVGINLPHIVFQPLEGEVQYKTADVTPVFWFHYTPDPLIVPEQSPHKSFGDFIKAAKADPGKLSLGGSGLNSANHAAHERLNAAFGIKTIYVPYKGTGDMTTAVLGAQIDGAMSYSAFAINNKGRVRALAIAMEKRHPLLPDVPTFRELGVGRRASFAPRAACSSARRCRDTRRRPSRSVPMLISSKPLLSAGVFISGSLLSAAQRQMDAFMKDKIRIYTEGAQRLGLRRK
jgi:tripartite-type tricarboxylate transporter receptor subunit TctC